MNCPSCGTVLQPDHRFCDSCGASVATASFATVGSEQAQMRSNFASTEQGAPFADPAASATMGYGTTTGVGSVTSRGFISSLFDFGFTSFVTTKVIKFVYVLFMILLGLGALGIAIVFFNISPLLGILGLVIVAPLYFLFYLALWRIFFELIIVIFRIAEDVHAMRNRAQP